jgi:hypothetical protein
VSAPTSIPILQSTHADDCEVHWIAVHTRTDGFAVRFKICDDGLGIPPRKRHRLAVRSEDAEHTATIGGGISGDGWGFVEDEFEPAVDEGVHRLALRLEWGDQVVEHIVELASPTRLATGALMRHEVWPASRWDTAWRTRRRLTAADANPTGPLPDEIVPLGAAVGEVAGGQLSFISCERWDDVWWLHEHWSNGAAVQGGLFSCDLELEVDSERVPARQLGGSSGSTGHAYRNAFHVDALPERMIVRRPATDGGPSLMEAELVVER